jgi:hypothetical protein
MFCHRRQFRLLLIIYIPGLEPVVLFTKRFSIAFFNTPSLGLDIFSISEKFIKSIVFTIVQIGINQSIRNNRKMSKPETIFKVGAVRAAVFRNTIEKNGQSIQLPKVVIEVRYKDKTGQWNGTNSLSINDLPKAILALQKAFEYLMEHKEAAQQNESAETDSYS